MGVYGGGCVKEMRKRQGRMEQVMLSDSTCKMCMGRVGGCVREVREREDGDRILYSLVNDPEALLVQ